MDEEGFKHMWATVVGLQKAMHLIVDIMAEDPVQAGKLREKLEWFAQLAREKNQHVGEVLVFEGLASRLADRSHPTAG